MGKYDLLINLLATLLVPLLPAFIIYKFLPSETVVKGPFKGLNINLTGAFSGYFLLVIISIGLTHFIFNNQLTEKLKDSKETIDSLNWQVVNLNSLIIKEKSKYHQWKMIGVLDSKAPERTKIFVDEDNISINALGKFKATIFVKSDDNNKTKLPEAVCFFNQTEGYNVIDLTEKQKVNIDTSINEIKIRDKIKLTVPVKYIKTNASVENALWTQ